MKKKMISPLLLGLLLIALSSCYKDMSTLADQPIEGIVLDTTGIPKVLYTGYQEMLTLTPKIKQGDQQSLSFQWSISEKVKSAQNTVMKPIGEQLELQYPIDRPIASTAYMLRLTITDRAHGDLQYFYTWDLHVQSRFITGLVIADTKDGQTSNLTYVKNKDFSPRYTKDEVIYRDILETDSTHISGIVSSLNYTSLGRFWRPHISQLWVTMTDGKVLRYNTSDFSVNGRSEKSDLILYKPADFRFNSFIKGGNFLFAHTNYGIYSLQSETVNVFSTPDPIVGKAQFSNHIVAGTSRSNIGLNILVWLEESTGAFTSYTQTHGFSFELGSFTRTNAFDPNDLGNKTPIAGDITRNHRFANFLLKDKKTGEYGIYQLDLGQASPSYIKGSAKGVFRIPSSFQEQMDNAVAYFFHKTENLMYIATQTEIYVMSFGLGDEVIVNMTPIYMLPTNERMQKAKLFVQGQYAARADEIIAKFVPELAYNLNALIVISQKDGKQGIVHVIPVTDNGTKIDAGKGHTYDGFGKVLDVISIGM